MSNTNKQAVKEFTKAHKTRIKDFHNVILTDIRGFQANLPEDSHVDPKVVNMFVTSVILYLKSLWKFASGELDSLTTFLLQEEQTQELTKGDYDLVKSIVSSHYDDLANAIVISLSSQIRSGSAMILKSDHQIKSTIEEVVHGTLDEDLTNILQEMDESVTTVEATSMEELKKENMELKAMLANIKTLVS